MNILTLSGISETAASTTVEARTKRDALLVLARTISACATPDDAQRAAYALKELKGFTRLIEDARTEVKTPVLDLGKRIDTLAKDLTYAVEQEAARVSRMLGTWQAEQNRIADEARRVAWQKEQDIKDEANRKIAAAKEASRTEATFERRAEKIEAQATQAIIETRVAAAAVAMPKPAGVSTRKEVRFEIIDLTALYEAAPYLVTLTPNTAAIKAAIKGLTGEQKLPGVRHYFEDVSVVR